MATFAERIQVIIDTNVGGAVRGFGQTGAAATELGTKTSLADRALASVGLQGVKTGTVMKTAVAGGALVAGARLVQFGKQGVDAFVGLTSEVRDFQRASGASAEDASRFVAVLDDMGIKSEVGEKAIFRLGREAHDGGPKLREFGVEIAHTKDGMPDLTGTLLNVADAYRATNDPAERAALAQAAFGRAGKELIPILEQGRKGLKEFFAAAEEGHQIFDQGDIDRGRQYELAIDNLQDAWRGLQLEIGEGVVPTLTTGANTLATLVNTADKATTPIGGLSSAIELSYKTIMPGIGLFENIGGVWEKDAGIAERFGSAARSVVPGLSAIWKDSDQAAESTNKLGDAQKAAETASIDYANALVDSGPKSDQAKEAKRRLVAANRELRDAESTVTKGFDDTALAADRVRLSEDQLALARISRVNTALALTLQEDQLETAMGEYRVALDAATAAGGSNVLLNEVLSDAQNRVTQELLGTATAAQQKAVAEATARGQTDAAKRGTDAYRDSLIFMAGTMAPGSPLRIHLEGIIRTLDEAGRPREAVVDIKVQNLEALDRARQKLDDFMRYTGRASINFGFGEIFLNGRGTGP
ncbi:MAG: hypothetical protein ACRDZ1_16805 [Acidimicrobiia bacterium]